MPTYEYECKTCGQTFDVFQSITAPPLRRTQCEFCGSVQPVRRLISGGGAVLFKGSGFYATDYRSEGYKRAAKAETGSSSKSTGGEAKDSSSNDKGTADAATSEAVKARKKGARGAAKAGK